MTYKYIRTFLTGLAPEPGGKYSTMRIVRSRQNWKIMDLIYGVIIPRLKRWAEVPDKFESAEEVRKFLHERGLYDFSIVDMRPKEDLK